MNIYQLHILIDQAETGNSQAKAKLKVWDSEVADNQVWISKDRDLVCKVVKVFRKKVKLIDFFKSEGNYIHLSQKSLVSNWMRVF